MNKININGFFLLGISVRTTNLGGQAMKDIAELWSRFMGDNILQQIADRVTDEIYSVYTDYETDYNGFYTTVLGCRVNSLNKIPEGLTCLIIPPDRYVRYVAKGKFPDCVAQTWQHIWNSTLDRKYTADFDVYGPKAQNPDEGEVEVYVAVK
jgi:predicted transcriptional regulator YdeE